MCGINGLWGGNLGLLDHANQILSHRGPDDSGIYIDEDNNLGLGHVRLSIVDLSATGHQPMLSNDGTVVVVFNGEIYNHNQLRSELVDKGFIFKGSSDTEVLLNLYILEGEQMLARLNGIFAFAIWDSNRRSLLIARDAFGVKPLYYSLNNELFAFSSEIKALLALLHISQELDIKSIDRYLSFQWCPGESTPFKSVRKLNPGEAVLLQNGKIINRWSWYQLPVFRSLTKSFSKSELIAGTRSHLRNAVQRQMVADVPVGAFLSGGLDSSSIVAFAREINPDIHCFTIDFGYHDEGLTADLPYARKVADYLRVPLEVVRIDSARMAVDLPDMVAQLDEPLADPAALNILYISRVAREHGIKVLLSGAGGDDLFSGYRRHQALIYEYLWTWLPYSLRVRLETITQRLDQRRSLFRRIRKLFNGAALDADSRLINYFRWIDRRDLMPLYSADFKAALCDSHADNPMLIYLSQLPPKTDRLECMLSLEQRFFLADHNLIYTDKMSMAEGVEVRVPFLDLELADFASQIPSFYKQRGLESKWVLKKAMEPYLPRDIIYRPKSGFGVPLRQWMRFELRELLADVLGRESLSRRGLFDPDAVQNLILLNDQGKVDGSYTLLSLLCVELWCRRFIDHPYLTIPSYQEAEI